jgi:hypothetical protein
VVGLMSALEGDQRRPGELAFRLSFDPEHGGKARRRTPDNWQDFQDMTIRLTEDRWSSEPADGCGAAQGKAPPASRRKFYDALVAAVARHPAGHNCTTMQQWEAMCLHRGAIDPARSADGKESYRERDARFRDFRKAKSDLIDHHYIAVEGDAVTDLRGGLW